MIDDLCATAASVHAGKLHARALLEASTALADGAANRHTFIRRFDAAQPNAGRLGGLAVSVKDLFDVAGEPTTAGSRVLAGAPGAARDCPAVERLRAAGATLIGHTNMTEFAYSGVGINPHHGTPANPATAGLDPTPRIPGGSTSGGAVSVATGAAWAALGSDTGGSIRIPAALQGLVGFKNTARLVPTDGTIPLSTTLDTACAITLSVRDAVLLHEILAARTVRRERRPLAARRLAVATNLFQDGMDPTVARAWSRSLERLRAAGARVDELRIDALAGLDALLRQGGFSAAESWAWHRARLERHAADYDPRVALRIRRGAAMSAADYIELVDARRAWILAMADALRGYDAVLSPTVPIVAPPLAPLVADDDAFFAANALLLRNPSAVNVLDGCAISLPCHDPDEMPAGLMVWSTALADDVVLDTALAIEAALARYRREAS